MNNLWRTQAIEAALQAEAMDGNGKDALLLAIRQHDSQLATVLLEPERVQFMRFLQTEAHNVRSVISGSTEYQVGEEWGPYIGWYAVEWHGAPIEIVVVPADYAGYVICIGSDGHVLRNFARAMDDYTMRPTGRSLLYSVTWRHAPELDAEIGKVSWDDVVLAPQVLSNVREAIEGFFRHKDAFTALGFAWRRGILLIGPPGTGKTMVCKATAAALPNLPFLYVRDLREEQGRDAIRTIFERARKLAPCILAFEDIDGLVMDMNRTVFLNELDGLRNNEGMLIIASSNHPGKIDEALLKRPSRFDRVFHIGLPALEERREYCRRVLLRSSLAERIAPSLDIEGLSLQVAERSEGFTPAYLKEAFTSAALQRAQAGAMVLDDQFAAAVLAQVGDLREYLRNMRDPEALAEMNGHGLNAIGFKR